MLKRSRVLFGNGKPSHDLPFSRDRSGCKGRHCSYVFDDRKRHLDILLFKVSRDIQSVETMHKAFRAVQANQEI